MSDSTRGPASIAPASGKLAILTPGMGAVATTFIAGVERVRRGLSSPMVRCHRWQRYVLANALENRSPLIKDFVPLAQLNDIVFGGWDPIPDDAYTAAKKAGVLESADLEAIGDFMKTVKPMPAVFESRYVTRITGATNVKTGKKQARSGRTDSPGHPRFQDEEQMLTRGHGVVRQHRDVHQGQRRARDD